MAGYPPPPEKVDSGYPSLCLSIKGFNAFIELLGGRENLKGKTTTEVKKILKAFSPCFEGPVVQHPLPSSPTLERSQCLCPTAMKVLSWTWWTV